MFDKLHNTSLWLSACIILSAYIHINLLNLHKSRHVQISRNDLFCGGLPLKLLEFFGLLLFLLCLM